MAWIHIPSPKEAASSVREFWGRQGGASGRVANIIRIQGLIPKALLGHYDLYKAIMFLPSSLSRREREMVAVTVSRLNACHY